MSLLKKLRDNVRWARSEGFTGTAQTLEETIRHLTAVRTAVADYLGSEGCSCCCGSDHDEHRVKLAKALHVPAIKDGVHGDWYDFSKYRSKK